MQVGSCFYFQTKFQSFKLFAKSLWNKVQSEKEDREIVRTKGALTIIFCHTQQILASKCGRGGSE